MDTDRKRVVGIVGGMSWESTVSYYQMINTEYNAVRGGHHSAPILLHSVDFAPIEEMQRAGDWNAAASRLASAARGLERAGAGLLLLATNTMHLVFDELVSATSVPWDHIADATGRSLQKDRRKRVALLGTRFTMEEPFYRDRLERQFDLDVRVPTGEDRQKIDRIIFEELVHGTIREDSRKIYHEIIGRLTADGADSVVLGCTEIGLLVDPKDLPIPAYDTARLHALSAVAWLLSDH